MCGDDHISKYEAERLAKEAAECASDKAVEKTFAIMGIDVKDPAQVKDFQKDLRFGSDLRQFVHQSTVKLAMTAIMLIVGGALYAMWDGIKMKLGGG